MGNFGGGDPLIIMLAVSLIAAVIAIIIGWEVSGRWTYLSSKTARRLKDTDATAVVDILEQLPQKSLARTLVEAGIDMSPMQFRMMCFGLAVLGTLAVWILFMPGLVPFVVGGLLWYIPHAYVKDRALGRGRMIDEKLPIALSRVATALQANHGLKETLESVSVSLQAEGENPLGPELLKTANDMRVMEAEKALMALAKRSPSLSLSNVAILLVSYSRAGGGQYADVVSDTAVSIQNIIAVRNHAQAKAAQSLSAAKAIPAMLGGVLMLMANDPITKTSFAHPILQIAMAGAMAIMLGGYFYMRGEVNKVA